MCVLVHRLAGMANVEQSHTHLMGVMEMMLPSAKAATDDATPKREGR